MFKKIVAVEPVNLTTDTEKELRLYAEKVCMYHDVPGDDQEIIHKIGDGDGTLVSYTSKISAHTIESCPPVRCTGICCNPYSRESANADTAYAEKNGITALGIRDYDDRGVVEFAISELVRLFHGYDRLPFGDMSIKTADLKVGIVGTGVSGEMVTDTIWFMGADALYYSRTRKTERESQGMTYRPLEEFLEYSEVVLACLDKNMILLHGEEFKRLGMGKLLFNIPISPVFNIPILSEWLDQEGDYFICDTEGTLRGPAGELLKHPHVVCACGSVGRTRQVFNLLSKRVLDNLRTFLDT